MASRNYSDTVPASTIVGPGGGVASGITNVGTALELSASIAGAISTPFILRLEPGTANEELVLVTAGAGSSGSPYTITRAQGTTTAKAHSTGSAVAHGIGSGDVTDARTAYDHTLLTAGVHGLSSLERVNAGFVGTSTGNSVTIASSTTETVIGKVTIPANEAGLGSVYTVVAFGTFGNQAVAQSMTFRLRIGGVAGALVGSAAVFTSNASAVTNRPFRAEGEVVLFNNPGGSATWHGVLQASADLTSVTLGNALAVATQINSASTAPVSGASNASLDVVITYQHGTSNASNTLTAFSGYQLRNY